MPIIRVETKIAAPRELVFGIVRNIDLHPLTLPGTRERIIDRGANTLLESGDVVTLEAVHFGVRQRITVRITEMRVPECFTDELISGAFRKLVHRHLFDELGTAECVMLDDFSFEAPLGIIGRIANRLFLTRYMHKLLVAHAAGVKRLAETQLTMAT